MSGQPNFPKVETGIQYARDILDGNIPACQWVKYASQRHFDDVKKSESTDWPYFFDVKKAVYPITVIETFPHTKGKWAAKGQLLTLSPWQLFIVGSIFGWVHKETGLRRFRKVFILVPRKNGKSALAAGLGNYMLASDGEHGAEVYAGATSQDQAMEVFKPAKIMAQKTPEFMDVFGVVVNASSITIPENDSQFKPMIGKPGDGASPSCAIHDEYHEHETDEQYDTMDTGMAAREQALQIVITTAGSNLAGPCYQMQKDVQQVLNGTMEDDRIFGIIYTIDQNDEWDSLESLIKANPNYGVSVDAEYLQDKLNDAKNKPRKQGTFKTKHLNLWVSAMYAFFEVEKWRENIDPDLQIEQFLGQPCIIGVDLAAKKDLTALDIIFKLDMCECEKATELRRKGKRYVRFGHYWLPEKTVELSENEKYRNWKDLPNFHICEGARVDYDEIKEFLIGFEEDNEKGFRDFYDLMELSFDPHNAAHLINQLDKEGIECIEVKPTVLNYSEPMKEMDAMIDEHQYAYPPDPIFEWSVSNVVAKYDRKDNVYPNKETESEKIDPVIAHLTGLCRFLVMEDDDEDKNFNAQLKRPVMVTS